MPVFNVLEILKTIFKIPGTLAVWLQIAILVGVFVSVMSLFYQTYNLLFNILVNSNTDDKFLGKIYCLLNSSGFFEGVITGLPVLMTSIGYIFAYSVSKRTIGFIQSASRF
jgi:hypothetical protein